MITRQSRSSRLYMPGLRTARLRAAITFLCAMACAATVAGHGIDPTPTRDGTTIAHTSARGGVSQMSAMRAEG
jgi:hypothetical protein